MICAVCGREDKFDFHVLDTVWICVVPEEWWDEHVCLSCFDELAFKKSYRYTIKVLYFDGHRQPITFTAREGIIEEERG